MRAAAVRPSLIEASGGIVPADVLLGLGVGTEEDIANRKSHHELEHENGEEHDHDEFASFVVELGPVPTPEVFVERLAGAIEQHDVLRLKGFADVPGKPMRLVVQAVGFADRPLFRPSLGSRAKHGPRVLS